MAGFDFKVTFMDDEGYVLDVDGCSITVEDTDDPEVDRDEAYSKADEWAELALEERGASHFEVSLTNAW